ncbi:hypothetical protein [Actinomadura roseirufa]|uniref:hypothetical protein n=1 Tax=Actinomadura roseirufa TaxID=2094049 RepID=UPI0013F146CE|nr:hypothetical protein [Actinomadura roseirufa]
MFEQPPCLDGHGEECPERACAECGTAVLVGPTPAPSPAEPPRAAPSGAPSGTRASDDANVNATGRGTTGPAASVRAVA